MKKAFLFLLCLLCFWPAPLYAGVREALEKGAKEIAEKGAYPSGSRMRRHGSRECRRERHERRGERRRSEHAPDRRFFRQLLRWH